MDKFVEEIFDYLGYGIHKSKCGLKIKERNGKALVILTELSDNPGTSITNAYEDIATRIFKERLSHLYPDSIRWIEHYPDRGGKNYKGEPEIKETFDEVLLPWNPIKPDYSKGRSPNGHGCYENPQWKHLKKEEVCQAMIS